MLKKLKPLYSNTDNNNNNTFVGGSLFRVFISLALLAPSYFSSPESGSLIDISKAPLSFVHLRVCREIFSGRYYLGAFFLNIGEQTDNNQVILKDKEVDPHTGKSYQTWVFPRRTLTFYKMNRKNVNQANVEPVNLISLLGDGQLYDLKTNSYKSLSYELFEKLYTDYGYEVVATGTHSYRGSSDEDQEDIINVSGHFKNQTFDHTKLEIKYNFSLKIDLTVNEGGANSEIKAVWDDYPAGSVQEGRYIEGIDEVSKYRKLIDPSFQDKGVNPIPVDAENAKPINVHD